MAIKHFGLKSEHEKLTAVMLYAPGPEIGSHPDPRSIHHLRPMDHAAISREFDRIITVFSDLGIQVIRMDPAPIDDDRSYLFNMMYCRDLFFMTPGGAILANMANETRRGEVRYAERALRSNGVPIVHAVSGEGRFEGADAVWVTERLVMVGVGNRTNKQACEQIKNTLREMDVECVAVRSHQTRTQHLLGTVQIVDKDLALVRHEIADTAVIRLLEDHHLTVVRIPENSEVLAKQAMNLVTVSPRKIIMTAGCPGTREIYARAGLTIAAELELSQLMCGAGGLACATGMIARV